MKKKLIPLILSIIALYIVTPLVINAHNIYVNKETIERFNKIYFRSRQIRQKSLLFPDGRFIGFRNRLEAMSGKYYYRAILECNNDPSKTLYRLRFFKEMKKNEYIPTGDMSFKGTLKDRYINSKYYPSHYPKVFKKMVYIYAEGISDDIMLNSLIKGAKHE